MGRILSDICLEVIALKLEYTVVFFSMSFFFFCCLPFSKWHSTSDNKENDVLISVWEPEKDTILKITASWKNKIYSQGMIFKFIVEIDLK